MWGPLQEFASWSWYHHHHMSRYHPHHITQEETNILAGEFLHWAWSPGLSASKAQAPTHRHRPPVVTTSFQLHGCEMSVEFESVGFFNQSAHYCRAMESETSEWKEHRNSCKRMLWTERLKYEAAPAPRPCPVWEDAPQVRGELGHKRAEYALNNDNKNPSSPLWESSPQQHASLTVPGLTNTGCPVQTGAEKGFLHYNIAPGHCISEHDVWEEASPVSSVQFQYYKAACSSINPRTRRGKRSS